MQLMDIPYILERVAYQQSIPDEPLKEVEDLSRIGAIDGSAGPVKPIFDCSRRVPFAQRNGEIIWYLDLDPGPGGSVGQVVHEDAECLELRVIARSLSALLSAYLSDMRSGQFHVDEDGKIISWEPWPRQRIE
jgi:hypothetical protein